jgi:UDP-N-acetylmuramate dehydrogenase
MTIMLPCIAIPYCMPLPRATAAGLRDAGVAFQEDVPLLKKTWWRAGGSADGFLDANDVQTVIAAQRVATQTDCPLFVLGNASNLLVSDRGIRGLVLRLRGSLASVDSGEGGRVRFGAGVKLVPLMNRIQREGWTGLEFLAGIPGTIGGAVRMNAGTALGEMVDALVEVEAVAPDGTLLRLGREALRMSYRTAHLPEGAIVTHTTLQTTGEDPETSRAAIREHLDHRGRTQPVHVPTCGSTFRNPPGDFAGRLIESSGLKGHRIGKAEVSTLHANFIVNTGGASAADIRALVEHVQHRVQKTKGVTLVREVHFVGDW